MLQKNAELKHLLLLRRLPYSGTKEKMASRLISHDQDQSVYHSAYALTGSRQLLISNIVLFLSRDSHLKSATRSISWSLHKMHSYHQTLRGQPEDTQRVFRLFKGSGQK